MDRIQRTLRHFAYMILLVTVASANAAHAQTGVSDDRVSLPEGPGSLEGVGENVDINPNMGSMSYSVPFRLPGGFGAVTPSLGLSYSSGSGNDVAGMGWSMEVPCIERMTYRGLPEYDQDDDFSYMGGQQIIRLPNTDPPQYRSRYESGFIRFTWMEVAGGNEGYWTAEHPDGSISYFGATSQGVLVDNARVSGDRGTFRYMLVEKIDVYGHKMTMEYIKDGPISLLSAVGYVYTTDANTPTYRATLEYEDRSSTNSAGVTRKDYLSDAKAGFNELLTRRLARVQVFSRGVPIRTYQLSYAPYDISGGFTLLTRVETLGLQGTTYPIVFDFTYSQGLGQQEPY
ncbi:MAG: SpvB/TcaC N-terminal domain-containing protein, partial [Myxococcota bacterium]